MVRFVRQYVATSSTRSTSGNALCLPGRPSAISSPPRSATNYRYSTYVQVAIDADTRLVIATGDPQPGNHNDCTVYRTSGIKDQIDNRPVMTDGGYQGNPGVIMPFRKPSNGTELPDWKEEPNAVHRKIRARVEHTLAAMKCWKILRDYRRAATTLSDAVSGIAHLHNITLTN